MRLSQRQKTFARLVHKGIPPYRAYPLAGYRPHHDHPYRLGESGGVKRYMAELQKRVMTRHDITIDNIIQKLEKAMELAQDEKQPSAMIQAALGQAKVCGLIVEKQQTTNIDGASVTELIAILREALGEDADLVLQRLGISDKPIPKANADGTEAVN